MLFVLAEVALTNAVESKHDVEGARLRRNIADAKFLHAKAAKECDALATELTCAPRSTRPFGLETQKQAALDASRRDVAERRAHPWMSMIPPMALPPPVASSTAASSSVAQPSAAPAPIASPPAAPIPPAPPPAAPTPTAIVGDDLLTDDEEDKQDPGLGLFGTEAASASAAAAASQPWFAHSEPQRPGAMSVGGAQVMMEDRKRAEEMDQVAIARRRSQGARVGARTASAHTSASG